MNNPLYILSKHDNPRVLLKALRDVNITKHRGDHFLFQQKWIATYSLYRGEIRRMMEVDVGEKITGFAPHCTHCWSASNFQTSKSKSTSNIFPQCQSMVL